MKSNRIASEETRPAGEKSVHLSDYFVILLEHKWIAMVPFLLILGGALALTLYATPVYEAEALIQIKGEQNKRDLISELQMLDSSSKVEAEMEIMHSRRVATAAAERLDAAGMGAFMAEVNSYRPLEVFLRAFGTRKPRCKVTLRTRALPGHDSPEFYRFRFVGGTVEVDKVSEGRFGDGRTTQRVEFTSGEPFTAFHRTFRLTVSGEPAGRTYEVRLRNRKDLTNWLRAHTTVTERGRKTGIIALGFQAPTPDLAEACSRVLAESFEDYKKTTRKDEARKAEEFLEGQVEKIHEDLRKAEQELDASQEEHGVTMLTEHARVIIEKISRLEREQVELEMGLQERERVLRNLRLEQIEPERIASVASDPIVARLAGDLAVLRLEKAGLDDETADHPTVVTLDRRISAARERLRLHVLDRLGQEIDTTRTRLGRTIELKAAAEDEERRLPLEERKLASRARRANSLLGIYNFLLEKKHEAGIATASAFINASIIDDPVLPKTRTSPNLMVNLLVGGFLALLAALGTAFFAEYLDRSIKTPEDLEAATGLPLYAALPSFRSVRSRELRKLKTQMVTIAKPNSVLAEGYRSLRANIRFADFESPVRAFAITSAVLGEGKTTTTLNLAVVMAQAGSKVVIVDADLRRPATHTHLGGSQTPGLTEVLGGKMDWRAVIRPVEGVEGLRVIHAGRKPDNPGAALDSDAFRVLLKELRDEYDYIVFDVPPILAVSDAASFFASLDAVFLLVQWRRCPVDVVMAARDQIERVGANLRGVIFNGFDARKTNRRGYGRYGYYGYYGGYRYGYYGYGSYHGGDSKKSKNKSKNKKNKGTVPSP